MAYLLTNNNLTNDDIVKSIYGKENVRKAQWNTEINSEEFKVGVGCNEKLIWFFGDTLFDETLDMSEAIHSSLGLPNKTLHFSANDSDLPVGFSLYNKTKNVKRLHRNSDFDITIDLGIRLDKEMQILNKYFPNLVKEDIDLTNYMEDKLNRIFIWSEEKEGFVVDDILTMVLNEHMGWPTVYYDFWPENTQGYIVKGKRKYSYVNKLKLERHWDYYYQKVYGFTLISNNIFGVNDFSNYINKIVKNITAEEFEIEKNIKRNTNIGQIIKFDKFILIDNHELAQAVCLTGKKVSSSYEATHKLVKQMKPQNDLISFFYTNTRTYGLCQYLSGKLNHLDVVKADNKKEIDLKIGTYSLREREIVAKLMEEYNNKVERYTELLYIMNSKLQQITNSTFRHILQRRKQEVKYFKFEPDM